MYIKIKIHINRTFFRLSICDLQIKVRRFAESLLVADRLFKVADRNVESIEGDCIEIQG